MAFGWVGAGNFGHQEEGEKATRRMPQIYEFDIGHADGTRYVDWTEGERVLNEIIYECQQSLKAIEHGKIDQEAKSWARGMGLRE